MKKTTILAVTLGALAAGGLLLTRCGGGDWEGHVLVITMDTTRADSLGCYGDTAVRTPNLDRIAAGGIRFEACYSPVPLTLPSHCTLFTGKYPPGHGVRNNGTYYLDEGETTLAEMLKDRGYQTYGVVAAFVLLSKFGLKQGFDVYDDSLDTHKLVTNYKSEIPADAVYQKFKAWFSRRGGQKFFAWVHFYDPHTPYEPPAGFFAEKDLEDKFALYRGEISYMDVYIGKIIEDLRREGILDDTLVVLVGDHGEAFGEHKEYASHSIFCYEENIRVPLIFSNPKLFPEAGVVDRRVDTTALVPTLLELMGAEIPDAVQGASVVSLMRGKDAPGSPTIYFETLYGQEEMNWAPLTGLIQGDYKYISLPEAELYDLKKDPKEARYLFRIHANVSKRLDRQLQELVLKHARAAGSSKRDLSTQDMEQLRSLGYISAFSRKSEAVVDPKRGIDLNIKLKELSRRVKAGELDGPERELNQIMREQPEMVNYLVYSLLYQIKSQRKDLRGALATLREGAEKFPDSTAFRSMLAVTLFDLGRFRRVVDEAEKILKIDPKFTRAHILLGDSYDRLGRAEDALREYRRAIELEPENVSLKITYAELLIKHNRMPDALAVYHAILDNPDVWNTPKILYQIALFNTRYGTMEKAAELLQRVVQLESAARYHFSLALVLAKLGRVAEGLQHMRQAVNSPGEDLSPEQRQQAEKAITAWTRAL